jgi:hypothetical protein
MWKHGGPVSPTVSGSGFARLLCQAIAPAPEDNQQCTIQKNGRMHVMHEPIKVEMGGPVIDGWMRRHLKTLQGDGYAV